MVTTPSQSPVLYVLIRFLAVTAISGINQSARISEDYLLIIFTHLPLLKYLK